MQNKRSSYFIELVKLQYSREVHGLIRGISVVNLVFTTGAKSDFYPINYLIYRNKLMASVRTTFFQRCPQILCTTSLSNPIFFFIDS
jgi:hypothetical protein